MARRTTQWFLSFQITLYLFLVFVQGKEDAEDAYKNGRNLVLEYFLPINVPVAVDVPLRREKRDVEGSGEEEGVLGGLNEKDFDEGENADNATGNAFARLLQDGQNSSVSALMGVEGSGEVGDVDESSEVSSSSSSSEERGSVVPLLADTEFFTTIGLEEVSENRAEMTTEETSTMIFDRSEDFDDIKAEETTTVASESTPAVILDSTTVKENQEESTTLAEDSTTEVAKSREDEVTTEVAEESTTSRVPTAAFATEPTTESPVDTTTVISSVVLGGDLESKSPLPTEAAPSTEETKEFTTSPPLTEPIMKAAPVDVTEGRAKTVIHENIIPAVTESATETPEDPSAPKFLTTVPVPAATEPPKTPPPIVEEIFKETQIHNKVEAMPGNILQKENLSLAADPLLITNTRLMDSEETVQLSSSEPKRLGAYIVIGLILLSFSSLVGYITFRKRMNRKRQEFESNQESNDTEKALLSLSDYKDSSELEENHLKNNEITPIVVKSNSQINKFEKNTNFSSPKNLNTTANEKNIEKDNVLKSTAENLTQVIIEGSPKDVEEDKNVPNMERLIVKTRIDQDSIPKKPIIINRSSTGYMPIPQDNV